MTPHRRMVWRHQQLHHMLTHEIARMYDVHEWTVCDLIYEHWLHRNEVAQRWRARILEREQRMEDA